MELNKKDTRTQAVFNLIVCCTVLSSLLKHTDKINLIVLFPTAQKILSIGMFTSVIFTFHSFYSSFASFIIKLLLLNSLFHSSHSNFIHLHRSNKYAHKIKLTLHSFFYQSYNSIKTRTHMM